MLDGSERARMEKRCPAVAWEGRLYSRGDARYRVVVTHHDCYTVEIETVDDMLHPNADAALLRRCGVFLASLDAAPSEEG